MICPRPKQNIGESVLNVRPTRTLSLIYSQSNSVHCDILLFFTIGYKKKVLIRSLFFFPQAKDEGTLTNLASQLAKDSIDHKLWIEQPENIPTCLAIKPYPKHDVQKYFKHLKLFK